MWIAKCFTHFSASTMLTSGCNIIKEFYIGLISGHELLNIDDLQNRVALN